MSRLLVSARDIAEAELCLAAGVDLIDLKEPRRGALGAVDVTIMREVVRRVAGRVPVSVALGEVMEAPGIDVPEGLTYAKFGLAGANDDPGWPVRWRRMRARLPASIVPVAVIYADGASVGAPSPTEIVRVGAELGCRVLLVDTALKNRGRLLDLVSVDAWTTLVAPAREAGWTIVAGGSLDEAAVEVVLGWGVDYVAVRGAACRGDRAGALDPQRLTRLVERVHGSPCRAAQTSSTAGGLVARTKQFG